MGTSLVAVKDELHSLARVQSFKDVLAPYRLPVEAWRAGLLSVFEQDAWLLAACDLPSVLNAGMTIAVLGLRMDKATGQSCIVPFKGKAQPIVMVQGYTVIASRAGYTLQARLVREGERFEEIGGSEPGIIHKPIPGNKGKAIGTYAVARSKVLPTLFTPFISLDEVLAVRDRSRGFQVARERGHSHPWATDFEAMMLKTGKRRLAKDIPNDQLHSAAWLDMQHDLGHLAFLQPGGRAVVEDVPVEGPLPERQPNVTDVEDLTEPPRKAAPLTWKLPDGRDLEARNPADWAAKVSQGIARQKDQGKLRAALERNREVIDAIMAEHPDHARTVLQAFQERGVSLRSPHHETVEASPAPPPADEGPPIKNWRPQTVGQEATTKAIRDLAASCHELAEVDALEAANEDRIKIYTTLNRARIHDALNARRRELGGKPK